MKEFFFGCGNGQSHAAIRQHPTPVNVMVNYASKVRYFPTSNVRLRFVDSGGYSFFHKDGVFDDRIDKYLKFVERHKADFFANRDYPCEPELLKRRDTTTFQNQILTLKNQIDIETFIENEYPELFKHFVAILQGWVLEDYLFMADYLNDHGLLTDVVGIGSVCRRFSDKEIKHIILGINEQFPVLNLHGFGIKFNVLWDGEVWDALYSADSVAYQYGLGKSWMGELSKVEYVSTRLMEWCQKLKDLEKYHSYNQSKSER